jgi:hypothetical protein
MMSKKIIFHNPFVGSWYGVNVFNYITKKKSISKYNYILDNIIKKYDKNIYFYIELEQNSFKFSFLHKFKLKKIITRLEFVFWCILNNVNYYKLNIIYNLEGTTVNDLFLSFSYDNLDISNRLPELSNAKCKIYFFLNHFMLDTPIISYNAEKLNVDCFIVENNLAKNSEYFKKYFPWYMGDVYHIPYVFQERFKNNINFKNRKNLCFATGTFEILPNKPRYKYFMDFFKSDTLHPVRKIIYQNKDNLDGLIDSKVSDYNEVKSKQIKGNVFNIAIAKIYNIFFVKQTKYFQFDVVQKYNEYKMFTVPEEASDMPGIGFVEGMACGGAYIGKDDPMYRDLGLVPMVHYISYDGTLDDLIVKIKFFQNNSDELEKIADNGYKFVNKNFNNKIVSEKLFYDLNQEPLASSFVSK